MPELKWVFESFPVLETRRCILRQILPEDADSVLRLMGNPEVNRYLGRHPMATMDQAIKRVELFQKHFDEQTGVIWGITLRDNPEIMGNCLLWNLVKAHYRVELGYAILPEYWGQGLITEIITAALDFAFHRMGLHSIEAIIDPNNGASRRVLEKQGFVQEGHFHEDYFDPVLEKFTDTAILSLLERNWKLPQNHYGAAKQDTTD